MQTLLYLKVEVALIGDRRKLLVVEGTETVTDDRNWQADPSPDQTPFCQEGWQATPAPAAPTTPKLIPVITTGQGMEAMTRAQTYAETLELSRKCHWRLAHPAQPGYQSWVCKGAGRQLRTLATASGGPRTHPLSGTVVTNQSGTLDRFEREGDASPRAHAHLSTERH